LTYVLPQKILLMPLKDTIFFGHMDQTKAINYTFRSCEPN